MKKHLLFLAYCLLPLWLTAQAPQRISYQSILRGPSGNVLINHDVALRVSILSGGPNGPVVYQETHSLVSDNDGLVRFQIGGGLVVSGAMQNINWGAGSYYIRTEADASFPSGGIAYDILGTEQLLSVPYALYAANTADTLPGPQGPQGIPGQDGKTIWSGNSVPSVTLGTDGDFFIDTLSLWFYGPKNSGSWGTGVSLVGAQGLTGAQGPAGGNGLNLLSGTSDPVSTTGIDGEYYINTTTYRIFGPKTAGNWGAGSIISGPQGIQGISGIAGINGTTIYFSYIPPNAITGNDGDFWIDENHAKVYGPKTAGSWGSGASYVGPQGPQGPVGSPGPSGKTVLNGTGNPTTATGLDGDFYINTSTWTLFGPKTAGSWGSGFALTGPQGPQGPQGPIGSGSGIYAHYVGELYAGGIVSHVFKDNLGNEHGLITALIDAGASHWCNINNTSMGYAANHPWNGQTNTTGILNFPGHTSSAAQLCDTSTAAGYNDWYLPSAGELLLVKKNILLVNTSLGATAGALPMNNYYWSSSEYGYGNIYTTMPQALAGEMTEYPETIPPPFPPFTKNQVLQVRCVRQY